MTVIVWDGKTLAADKLALSGNKQVTVTKIFKHEGHLYATCGSFDTAQEIAQWVYTGSDPDAWPDEFQTDDERNCTLLKVDVDGELWLYETCPYPFKIEDPVFTMGSGAMSALAALYCGKTAKEAVEITTLCDASCGRGVDVLTLE